MNYYERHLGDYAKNAGHLSMLEHGAYTLLLDRYYSSEKGIPEKDTYKIARAASAAERRAVDSVLREFFTIDNGLWVKGRCEEELQRYRDSIPAAEEKRENDKDRQRRARERRKSLFAELKSHGVVMSFDTPTSELHNQLSRVTSRDSHADVTPIVTCDNTATSLQSPVSIQESLRGEPPSVDQALYAEARTIFGAAIGGQVSKAIKSHGKPWTLGVIENCRRMDPQQARAYFAAALNGSGKPKEAEQRRAVP